MNAMIANIQQLNSSMGNFQLAVNQAQVTTQTAVPRLSQVTFQFQRMLNIFRKMSATMQRVIDNVVNTFGTFAKGFMRIVSVAADFLGPIIGFAVYTATFVGTAITSLIGMGYNFGRWLWDKMVGLGDSILQDYLTASGTFASIGGIRAYRTAFGMLPEDTGLLPNIAEARGNIAARQMMALKTLGITRFGDTADIMVQATLAAARFMKSQPKGQELLNAISRGLTYLFSAQTLLSLGAISDAELQRAKENYENSKKKLAFTEEAREALIDFRRNNQLVWQRIETIIISKLADKKFAETISRLSAAFVKFVKTLMESKQMDAIIRHAVIWVRNLSKKITSPEFKQILAHIWQTVKDIIKILFQGAKRIISWFSSLPPSARPGVFSTISGISIPGTRFDYPEFRRPGYPGYMKRPGYPGYVPEPRVKVFRPGISRPGAVTPDYPGKIIPTTGTKEPGFSPEVNRAIDAAASSSGMSKSVLRAIADIESSGDPRNVTGSYKGLFQLSEEEFRNNGGTGNIFDPVANAQAAARKIKKEGLELSGKLGRPVSDAELYLAHQQGVAGAYQHLTHPNQPAWQSMFATGEGQQKGAEWAKRAIWGNIANVDKPRFGSVENVTSQQFADYWREKYGRRIGAVVPTPSSGATTEDLEYLRAHGGHSTIKLQTVPGGSTDGGLPPFNADLAKRLRQAGEAYKQETGRDPVYGEMTRDYATQAEYYRRYQAGGGKAAPPGRSRHEGGNAIDIPSTAFLDWMHKNSTKYGINFPVSGDPVHAQLVPGIADSNVSAPVVTPTSPFGWHRYFRRKGEAGEFNWAATGVFGAPGENLTTITLKNGKQSVVNKALADRYTGFLNELIDAGYPVNVTTEGSGYVMRGKVGGGGTSMHAYGAAVDVNPEQNPWQQGVTDLPPDIEVRAWRHGLSWGARFGDPMHFEPMSPDVWKSKLRQLKERGISTEVPKMEGGEYQDQRTKASDDTDESHPINKLKVDNRSDMDVHESKSDSDNDAQAAAN